MSWSLAVTVTATALSAGTAVPQLWRLRRHPPAGVSLAAAGNAAVNGFAWMLYGAGTGTPALVVASAGPAAGATAVAVAVARAAGRRGLGLVAAWTTLLGGVGLTGGWRALGAVLGFSVWMSYSPQVVTTWRSRDLTGLAVGTWALALGEGLLWGGYGVVHGDLALMLWGGAATAAAAAVLTGWGRWRRRIGPVVSGTAGRDVTPPRSGERRSGTVAEALAGGPPARPTAP